MTDEANMTVNGQLSAAAAVLDEQTAEGPDLAGASVFFRPIGGQGRKVFPTVFQETKKPQQLYLMLYLVG